MNGPGSFPITVTWAPDSEPWSPCHVCQKPGGPDDDIRYRTIRTDRPTFQWRGECKLTVPLCDACAATQELVT